MHNQAKRGTQRLSRSRATVVFGSVLTQTTIQITQHIQFTTGQQICPSRLECRSFSETVIDVPLVKKKKLPVALRGIDSTKKNWNKQPMFQFRRKQNKVLDS